MLVFGGVLFEEDDAPGSNRAVRLEVIFHDGP